MTLEDFDKFCEIALSATRDAVADEWYSTDRQILDELLRRSRAMLFADELVRKERHALYLKLKAEFEGKEP